MSMERPGTSLEAVTSVNDLESEKVAEKAEWLKHKISGIGSAALLDMIRVGQESLAGYEKYARSRERRADALPAQLVFSDLSHNSYSTIGLDSVTKDRYHWLIGDDSGIAKDLPLTKVIEVVKEELVIRYQEGLDNLGKTSTQEEIIRLDPNRKVETQIAA